MNAPEKLNRLLQVPFLTRKRIWCAYITSVLTDAVQIIFGPLGWAIIDQGLDVLAMAITTAALGFHPLLLPTFVLEFIPMADMLPTWTGCTAAVVFLRKKAQSVPPPPLSASVFSPPNSPPALPQLPLGNPLDSNPQTPHPPGQ